MSDFTAVNAVVKRGKLFVSDLQSIQNDPDFILKNWAEAKCIEKGITFRTFVLGLHFMFGLLDGLKKFSVISRNINRKRSISNRLIELGRTI